MAMARPGDIAKRPATQDDTGARGPRLPRHALIPGTALLSLFPTGPALASAARGLPAQADPAELRILIGTLVVILALALAQIVKRRRGPDRATARSTLQLR